MTAIWESFFLVMKCDYSRITISDLAIVLMVLIFNECFFLRYYGDLNCNAEVTVNYIAFLQKAKTENGNITFSWPILGWEYYFPL